MYLMKYISIINPIFIIVNSPPSTHPTYTHHHRYPTNTNPIHTLHTQTTTTTHYLPTFYQPHIIHLQSELRTVDELSSAIQECRRRLASFVDHASSDDLDPWPKVKSASHSPQPSSSHSPSRLPPSYPRSRSRSPSTTTTTTTAAVVVNTVDQALAAESRQMSLAMTTPQGTALVHQLIALRLRLNDCQVSI